MQRIQIRTTFWLCFFLITSTISFAQSWIELGKISKSNLDYIPVIATDASGNVYTCIRNDDGKYDIVKWDGTIWTEVGNLNANGGATVIAIDNASGNIYITGGFTNSSDKNYVAKWDGTSWSELGTGTNALHANNFISAIAIDANGNVYAAGAFDNGSEILSVAKWNGTTWSRLGTENELNATYVIAGLVVDASGNVYAAITAYGQNRALVAKWDGTSWSELGGGNSFEGKGMLWALLIDKSGYIYAAGQISNSKGYRYIAKWDGTSWSELGKLSQRSTSINSLAADDLGNIYAAGYGFTDDDETYYYVPKWNGTEWTELKTNGTVSYLNIDQSGNIYGTGNFSQLSHKYYIAKYDPTATPVTDIPTTPTTTGINQSQQQKALQFYPNPVTNMVSCDVPEAGVMEVYSMQGAVLYTQQVSAGISSIDLSALATGMYCVSFKGQSNSYAPMKIVKQ